jgi:hypothetical protein
MGRPTAQEAHDHHGKNDDADDSSRSLHGTDSRKIDAIAGDASGCPENGMENATARKSRFSANLSRFRAISSDHGHLRARAIHIVSWFAFRFPRVLGSL